MRVLLQNRASLLKSVAGDTVQLVKTREYLLKLGIEVEISADPNLNLQGYDLIHLFNIMPVEETYCFFLNARRQEKKMVLSTIFWDPQEFLQKTGENQKFGIWWQQTMAMRREILNGVRLILPNSKMEEESLRQFFPTLPPSVVIPNASDQSFAKAQPDRFRKRYNPYPEFVLSVGRICQRKNQQNLIKAVKPLKLPLILIGPLNDTFYYQQCRREAAGFKVIFLDSLNQTELASAYAAAKVHALVSWYDTPGLVSLEAALAGCRIVSTDRGSPKEYLGDQAFYCQPDNLHSITQAILNAWEAPPDSILKEKILREYTWEQAALTTLHAYQRALTEK